MTDREIEELQEQLYRLTVEFEQRTNELDDRISALRRSNRLRENDASTSTELNANNEETVVKKNRFPYSNLTVVSNRRDAEGAHLEINDRVSFLSRGEQQSTTGVIRGFSKRFVNVEDDHNHIVRKEPHNLKKISR